MAHLKEQAFSSARLRGNHEIQMWRLKRAKNMLQKRELLLFLSYDKYGKVC